MLLLTDPRFSPQVRHALPLMSRNMLSPAPVTQLVIRSQTEQFSDHCSSASPKQTYRETMHGVCSFMGWSQVLEFDSASSSLDDNPFAGSRIPNTSKVSVKVPVDEWLCRKFEKLTLYTSLYRKDTLHALQKQ